MHEYFLIDILILLTAAVVSIATFHLLRLPPVLGYLVVGALVGPYGLGWLVDAAEIRFLAELGVMFLLFMLGLEFSWPVLWHLRHAVFGVGGGQVVVTTLLAGLIGYSAGLPGPTAFIVGGALAMSSTAVLLKQLTDQGELNTRHGRMAIGVLLFQDLATLPFLVSLPVLGGAPEKLVVALPWALVKASAVFTLILVVGRWLTSPIIHWVAASRSTELFVLVSLLMILAAAGLAELAGLSMPLGAFLAGMVVGETRFKHQIQADIRPFQDVLLGLFFVTIGMQLNTATLTNHWPIVIALLAAVLVIKPAVVLLVGLVAHTNRAVSLRAGLSLAHVGEFGLLIASLAMRRGILAPEPGQIVLTTMVLSMALAPLLVRWNYAIVKTLNLFGYRANLAAQEQQVAQVAEAMNEHMILCGYGRVGQSLSRFFDLEGLPYVALDLDAELVAKAEAAGKPVMYGDAGRFTLLEAAGIHRARAMVITFNQVEMALKILQQARHHRVDLPILVRTMDVSDSKRLRDAGATEVLPEALETSVFMGAQLLSIMGVPRSRIEEHMETVRESEYQLLREIFSDATTSTTKEHPEEALQTVRLPEKADAVGHTPASLELRDRRVTLLAIRRDGKKIQKPGDDIRIRAGDVLILSGHTGDLARVKKYLLNDGSDGPRVKPD